MDGGDFIQLAAKMALSASANAASHHSARSRAYYGAFHLARTMLTEIGFRCHVRGTSIYSCNDILPTAGMRKHWRSAAYWRTCTKTGKKPTTILTICERKRNKWRYFASSAPTGSETG